MNIAKSSRTSGLKIICKRLLPPFKTCCIRNLLILAEDASFVILEDSIWLQFIYFLTTNAFWHTKYLFSNALCSIYCSNQGLWKIHGIALINLNCFAIDESSQVKIPCEIMWCQGYFLKIALETRLFM